MTNPVSTTAIHGFVQWGPDQDQLLESLTVLSKVKPNDKIKIVDQKTKKIGIEDRSWLTLTRFYYGDGCKPTVEIINRIMTDSFEFASRAKEHLAKRNLEKQTDPKLNSHPTLLEADKALLDKFVELRKYLGKALWGMSYLRDLYGSDVECEPSISSDLTKKINMHYRTVLGLYDENEPKERLPDLIEPIKAPELTASSSDSSSALQLTIGAISIGCSAVSWYSFTKSAVGIVCDVHHLAFGTDVTALSKVGTALHTSAKVINITGVLR